MRVEQAIELATRFHEGAVDKAGRPYIGHILRVVDAVNTHEEKLAAAMHDLLEDTPLTSRHLSCAGSPPDTTLAVEALTRVPGERYEEFCQRAATHPVARVVKLADVADNADEGRLALLAPAEAARLRTKYQRARSILSNAPEPPLEKSQREYEVEFATIGIPQGTGETWSTFWCATCGLPAGTLTLMWADAPDSLGGPTGHRLVLTTFLGIMAPPMGDSEYEGVKALLERADAQAFYDRNRELAPFWCPACQLTYCGDHWQQQTKFDDGFFDEIVGTCSQGHRRQLWD
jgi:hypothetical protein